MKRKRITIVTEQGRIVTNHYPTLAGAIKATGVRRVLGATVKPLPFCGVGPCDDCIGCDA
jgi:hypothetical protein